jgi:hypothetical protein
VWIFNGVQSVKGINECLNLDFVLAILLNQPTHYLPNKNPMYNINRQSISSIDGFQPGYSISESPATTTEEEKFTN